MQDFTKSYDSLAATAEEILNQSQTEDSVDKEEIAEASNYEKKYGDRILRKLGKRKGKQITKREWDKADKDQRSSWISSLPFSHSDDVAKYIGVSWEDLPTVAKVNMFEEA